MKYGTFIMALFAVVTPTPAAIAENPARKSDLTCYFVRGTSVYGLSPTPATANRFVAFGMDGKPISNYLGIKPDAGDLCRWRVTPDAIWVADHQAGLDDTILRIPNEDLALYDAADADGRKKLVKKYGLPPTDFAFPNDWSVSPATQAAQRRVRGGLPSRKDYVNFDVLPRDKDSCLLFVQDGTTMVVWTGKASKYDPAVAVNLVVRYQQTEKFEAGFTDQFIVLPHGDDYLFLTAGGQLHLADRSAGGFRTTRPVWKGKDKPIRLVVTDVDSGTVGLFAPDSDDTIRYGAAYFILSKGKATQKFIPDELGEYPNGLDDPKLALELLNKYVRPKK